MGVNFGDGLASAVVWSPEASQVDLCFKDQKLPLSKSLRGYWKGQTGQLVPGDLYTFQINGEKEFPDPASLSQPEGVHGSSGAVDLTVFQWTDEGWENLPLNEYIFYELHTGSFTPDGTFAGIEKKLDHLLELGINAIEIMPVAQFPGDRNWGYDGVYPFAVQNSYGGAEGLQRLVNACHLRGIAVVLDVVYNHLGPEGNYLNAYGPYTTSKYHTPWGGAINFDDAWCDGVRRYFIENVLMWFRDFHIDALRLDAVHAIKDFGPKHILQEMKERVEEWTEVSGRKHYLIVELDLNDPRFINTPEKGGYGMDAQWIDEFHHALRVAAGGEKTGYYSDFDGLNHLAKAYKDAYVYDGQFSAHRKKFFGVKAENEGHQFVVFSQNHDQVGNRMLGERSSQLESFEMQKLLAAAVLVSPYLPMLFMGEEWSEPHPFLYFVSHTDPELAEAVRKGRKEEFAAFHQGEDAPDPMAVETFLQSKLQWELPAQKPHQTMLAYYKALIALRRKQPALKHLSRKSVHVYLDKEKEVLTLYRWTEFEHIFCLMNFSKERQFILPHFNAGDFNLLFNSAATEWEGPGSGDLDPVVPPPAPSTLLLQPESIMIYAGEDYNLVTPAYHGDSDLNSSIKTNV